MKLMISLPKHWSHRSICRCAEYSHIVESLINPFVQVDAWAGCVCRVPVHSSIHRRHSLETYKHFTVRTLQFHVYVVTLQRFKINLLNYLFITSSSDDACEKLAMRTLYTRFYHFRCFFLSLFIFICW